jgi:hypothetical protein
MQKPSSGSSYSPWVVEKGLIVLARHTVERNRSLDQPVFRFDEIENADNTKFGGKLLCPHRSFLSPEIIIADRGWRTLPNWLR